MLHPSHDTIAGMILPSLGILIDIIVFLALITINKNFKLNINVHYTSNLITVILNLVINTFLIKKINKQDKLIKLLLKVSNKLPINYDYSMVLFNDNNGNNYFICTDLDEKFNLGQLYEVKLKNKKIASKSVNIQGKDFLEIKIDASYFKCIEPL